MCNSPTKICSKCHLEKPINLFQEGRNQCVECRQTYRRSRGKEAYEVNKKWLAKQDPDYSAAHRRKQMKDPIKRERMIGNKNRWISENRDHVNARGRINNRIRYHRDANSRMAAVLRSRFYGTVSGEYKSNSVLGLLGCPLPEFRAYLQSLFLPGMSWDNWGHGEGKWNIDHVLPIASFDMSNEEDQRKCWHYSNTQPLWHRDNMIKSDMLPCGTLARFKEKASNV